MPSLQHSSGWCSRKELGWSADKCTTLSRTLAEHTQKEEKLRAEVTAAAHTKAKMAELQEELESARERGQKAEKESLTFKKEMATHRSGKDSALQELAAANAEIAMLKKQLQAERDGAKDNYFKKRDEDKAGQPTS